MLMYSTVCKQHGNEDHGIAPFITAGFIGQLKGWWDNYLSSKQRDEILTHKKVKSEVGTSTTQPMAIEEPDAVYTLCLAILHHFVGSSVPISEKLNTLL
ncbi:hypothetical protein A2U01_0033576, partial [Trifolium medium]|nr:hypothetical protein [Trifolium medium]